MTRKLVLFDIDGTLVRDDGAARDAFAAGLREIYGLDSNLLRYDFSGRTDPAIMHMVLADSGLTRSQVEEGFGAMWEAYVERLQKNVTATRVRVMPGIVRLLDTLAAMPEITLGLMTGNIERGARIKLAPHDLNRYFSFGAFGSDSANREELPPIAVERAAEYGANGITTRDAVVIGDSIWDIRCSRPHGARAIAVATGPTHADTLRSESPDVLFETLEGVDEVVTAILA